MYKALTLPLLVTIFFHGILLAFILIDLPDSEPTVRRAATKYIEAKLVTIEKPKVVKKAAPKKTTPVAKPDDQAKRLAAQKLQEQKVQQQKVQEQKLQEQKLQEQKRQQELAREQQIKQEREKIEQQQRIQEQNERELAEAINQENERQQVATDAELANSYIALITEVIQNNWNRPPSARNNMEAELALQLVPTGEVVSVNVVSSSGNSAFDRSAENAVLKAARFPELQNLPNRVFEDYFRRLRLKFRPEDLRL
jgi:colicin import membrane protein